MTLAHVVFGCLKLWENNKHENIKQKTTEEELHL
jgi:hypothetical protein